MATTTLRPLRVFRNYYLCDECPNEWTDEMLTVSHSWCPCCDKQCDPYDSVAFIEECDDDIDEMVTDDMLADMDEECE